jgi:two-component system LytT family response regulator
MTTSSQPLRIVIVDDEAPARALLAEYLQSIPGCELVASCRDGFEAVERIGELAPDLVILDIQMPKLNGFDVVDLLRIRPAIIFATAFEEHAVKAFDIAAVDYLLKPFDADRFRQAVQRARGRIERRQRQDLDAVLAPRRSQRVLVRHQGSIHVLAADRIDYVESQDDYILLHSGTAVLRKKQTLKSLTEQLDAERFVRVHRCFLLNIDRLDRLEPYSSESRVAILTDGTRIPISRAGYNRLRRQLEPS